MRHHETNENQIAHRKAQYAQADVNGRLIINLRDISHTMRGMYEGRGSQKRVLIVLSETGPITQRELTERLGIQPGSASEVIAKLEAAGLLARTPSETDRRTADLSLTEKGQAMAEEAKAQRVQRHMDMFSVLSEEEKAQLLALLEKVNADWETRCVQGPENHCHHHHHHSCEEGHGPHSEWEGHGHRPEGAFHHAKEHGPHDGEKNRRSCNHDCLHCPNPCGKGRALREGNL